MSPDEAMAMLADRQVIYRQTFGTAHGKAALDDLATFCRARETCVIPGDRDRTYVLEGRREVFLRIKDFLDRPAEELFAIYFKPGATNAARG